MVAVADKDSVRNMRLYLLLDLDKSIPQDLPSLPLNII